MKISSIISTILLFAFISCDRTKVEVEESVCSCPHCTIYIQPYDNFTKQEAIDILPSIEKSFNEWLCGQWEFKLLTPKSIPTEAYVEHWNKYKAKVILDSLNKNIKDKKEVVYIGLTHKDICADLHNVDNYGIIGYSYSPGYVCIVSDKRIKTKSMIWKPILHEFIHAFYGAPHCPKDDKTCFMVNFKGKGNVEKQKWLCDSCKY